MKARLAAGSAISWRGAPYLVMKFEDGQIRLRAADSLEERTVASGELLSDPSFRIEGAEGPVLSPTQPFWDRLPNDVREAALSREEHVREVLTGFRLGQASDRFPGEPRAAYASTTRSERVASKAAELGLSYRQVNRWLAEYHRAGNHPAGLVNRKTVRTSSRLGQQEADLAEAIMRVARQQTKATDVTFIRLRLLVENELIAMGRGDVKLPAQPTFIALVRRFAPELTHLAKRRRSDASRGTARPFGKVVCTRPGQYVQIDITPFDILARSEVDGRELRLRLILALDLYSRAIVAARLVEYEPKGVDVSTILLDIVHPVRPHPSWPPLPDDARLPYLGIPDGVMLAAHDMPEGTPLLNIPPVLPEAVVVDNGMVFLSGQFRDLCARLGTDVMLARPGTGSDKAHIERLFLHIRQSLAERLQGYVGPHVLARGHHPRAVHFPWEVQFEVVQWVARYYNHRPHEGLAHPTSPRVKLTPAQMFAFGVQHAGHLTVPVNRNAFYLALRTELRLITDVGVRIDGWQYDSDVLNPFRNAESPYLELGKKWPFKVDARDPTLIHFQDPVSLSWHEIPERDADWRSRPFQQEHVDRVKVALEERREADPTGGLRQVQREMDDAYAARVEQSVRIAARQQLEGLSIRRRQDIARSETARTQRQELTRRAAESEQPATHQAAPHQATTHQPATRQDITPHPGVREEQAAPRPEADTTIEVVGDDF
nr:hypothetical protein D3W47_13200 [Deinococcus sp. RM]